MIPPSPSDPNLDVEQRITLLEQELAILQTRLTQLEKNSLRWDKIFQPRMGFVIACVSTAVFFLFCFAVFEDQELRHYLSYVVPIVLPFIGFIFDRLERYFKRRSVLGIVLDTLVLAVSLARSVYDVPYISGHAVFLAFALLTVKSWWVRLPVMAVILQVIYLKEFVWHDATLYGGLLVGSLAAAIWWGAVKKIY